MAEGFDTPPLAKEDGPKLQTGDIPTTINDSSTINLAKALKKRKQPSLAR